jgi:hypothetical protein
MAALSAARHRLTSHRMRGNRGGRARVPLIAGLGVAAMLAGSIVYAVGANAATLAAQFDWSVPDRLTYRINGAPDVSVPTRQFVSPSSWRVDLNGCASRPPDRPIARYNWRITLPDRVEERTSTGCQETIDVPAQGTYPVALTITMFNGETATKAGYITVRDYLIAVLGDSVASGEGSPDFLAFGGHLGGWTDTRCHRSGWSGPAQAAGRIERSDPHTSVTLITLACSGAGIIEGLLNAYAGQEPPSGAAPLPPQVGALAGLLCPAGATCPSKNERRNIDSLLIQAGANDLHFSEIVYDCAKPFPWFRGCDTSDGDIARRLVSDMNELPSRYDALNQALNDGLRYSAVHIGEYFDPTHNADGSPCEMVLKDAGPDLGIFTPDGVISASESAWAYLKIILPMNEVIHQKAAEHGWNVLDGIAAEFGPHGYCANDHWIVRYEEAIRDQSNLDGTMHPNRRGQLVYADRMVRGMQQMTAKALYTAVWQRSDEGEIQLYEAPYADYRATYDGLWDQGLRLKALSTTLLNGQVRYTAVWQPSNEGEIQLYEATWDQYRATHDELWDQGWRLKLLDTFVHDGQLKYTAVWQPSTADEVAVYGWRPQDYRAKYDELWNQGWRLKSLSTNVLGGQVLYTAVWQPSDEGEVQLYEATWDQYRATHEELWNQGWRLKLLDTLVQDGQLKYTAVWQPSTADEVAVYGWQYVDYRATYDELWNQGWRLKLLNVRAA